MIKCQQENTCAHTPENLKRQAFARFKACEICLKSLCRAVFMPETHANGLREMMFYDAIRYISQPERIPFTLQKVSFCD